MRIGIVGSSYTVQSSAVADQELINFYAETNESGAAVGQEQYGGRSGGPLKCLYGTPGLSVFCTFPAGPVRGQISANGREFAIADTRFYEVFADGTFTDLGFVATDGLAASIIFNSIQLLIVSGGSAYCFTLGTNVLLDVSAQLAGAPMQCDYSDTFGIVIFQNSNKYQISQLLDFSVWPGQLVGEVSVFPDNLVSVIANHREVWIFGNKRAQPYQDTGSLEVFDVIGGAMIENGSGATFSVSRLDNSIFWIGQDERGAWIAWRSQGYTPSRISTHAVEVWLSQQVNVANLTSYSYQDRGHLFWVLYVPGGDCTWVYDVGEGLWHKRGAWDGQVFSPHWSWNHAFCFGKHLVGDWNTGNLYQMDFANLTDNGTTIRRLIRSPTQGSEMQWQVFPRFTADFETGLGPQPPLQDGDGNDRPPQAMLRTSDNRGRTWSNEHVANCGFAGEFNTRVFWTRLGRSRYRVWELSVTDPIPWTLLDCYVEVQ